MGTRSLTIFKDGQEEIAVLYRHFDGYPEVHGMDLAGFLSGLKIVNGIPFGSNDRMANGASCLAVQMIHYLKQKEAYDPCRKSYHGGAGNLYLCKAGTRDSGEEWTYVLTCLPDTDSVQVEVWNGEEGKSDKVFEGPARDFSCFCNEVKDKRDAERAAACRKTYGDVKYINKAIKDVRKLGIVTVPSKSEPGVFHKVARLSNGEMVCTCKGFEHRKTCRHIKEANL